MEKRKSLLDKDSMKRKLAKLSPRERARVEQSILEGEKESRKMQRAEEALMRLPKEKRLKKICGEAIETCWFFAQSFGARFGEGDSEPGDFNKKFLKTQAKSSLTLQLKKAGVLPLEG